MNAEDAKDTRRTRSSPIILFLRALCASSASSALKAPVGVKIDLERSEALNSIAASAAGGGFPRIPVFGCAHCKTWVAGTSPATTSFEVVFES